MILRFRPRTVADNEEDFVTELEHQRGLGEHVAKEMQRVFLGEISFSSGDITKVQGSRVLELAKKRGIEIP